MIMVLIVTNLDAPYPNQIKYMESFGSYYNRYWLDLDDII